MSNQNNGLGLGAILAIVFTVLKLCGVINWSWWWVLLPVWGPLALVVLLAIGAGLVAVTLTVGTGLVGTLVSKVKNK